MSPFGDLAVGDDRSGGGPLGHPDQAKHPTPRLVVYNVLSGAVGAVLSEPFKSADYDERPAAEAFVPPEPAEGEPDNPLYFATASQVAAARRVCVCGGGKGPQRRCVVIMTVTKVPTPWRARGCENGASPCAGGPSA